jgi:hypothetical protein
VAFGISFVFFMFVQFGTFGRYDPPVDLWPESQRATLLSMPDEHSDSDSAINEAVRLLKLKIPKADYGALESRFEA